MKTIVINIIKINVFAIFTRFRVLLFIKNSQYLAQNFKWALTVD